MSIGAAIGGIGAGIGALLSASNASKNRAMQEKFAKKGIQWRVEDALAAGIHPLYALGAQTHSFAPVDASGVSAGIGQMGQDLGRAVDSMRTTGEKATAFGVAMQRLQLERGGLENELLRSQIARMQQAGTMPPAPGSNYSIPGQSGSKLVVDLPQERVVGAPGQPSQEPAPITDVGHAQTATGLAPVMSQDVKQRLEEDWWGTTLWNLRNRIIPTPPAQSPGPGKQWVFNGFEWQAWDKHWLRKKWQGGSGPTPGDFN